MIAERGRGRLPRETPRETDFAAERPKGDGFRLVSVSLACFRDIPPGKLPRGRPRVTPPAARPLEGDRAPPAPGLPRMLSRHPDGTAAAKRPEGDGFCREASQGRRISPDSRLPRAFPWHPPLNRRRTPPSTQKARLKRRAFNTKLCSRTRAYRLSASTGQEEMQAPHSMHSSSLTSA